MIDILRVPVGDRLRTPRFPWQKPNLFERFVAFPREGLPRGPLHTPLLDVEQGEAMDRNSHPFYREAKAELFLAMRGGEVVGRIGAIVNDEANTFLKSNAGQFGFYEAIDDQDVANALLGAAEEWIRERGKDEMLGPASPSQHYYYGSRALSDEEPPRTPSRFLETYNPDYYNRQYERYGLECVHRMVGYDADLCDPQVLQAADRFRRAISETINSTGLVIRPLDVEELDDELSLANDLINRSLTANWGFAPMTRSELAHTAAQMRLLIDPQLVLFAELGGEPVGIALAMPDYNQVFKAMGGELGGWPSVFRFDNMPLIRHHWPHGHAWADLTIDAARVIALGVVPTVWRGGTRVRRELLRLGPALVYAAFDAVRRAGYRTLTASWILEENRAMRAPFQIVGVEPTRWWRVYRKAL